MKTPTIYEIKDSVTGHFFDRDTMKHFGQTLKMFKTVRSPAGNVYVYAPRYMPNEKHQMRFNGYTFWRYDEEKHELHPIPADVNHFEYSAIRNHIEHN